MQSKNLGLIIYIKPIKDNDLFIKILSFNDEIVSGIVYGGNSSKKRSIYQTGYFIEFNQFSKNNNSITTINGEVTSPFIGSIFNNKFKSFSILSIVSILNISIYEGQKIYGVFNSVKNLINHINNNKKWIAIYCEWLLYFLKLIGYEIDYINKNHMKYFNLNSLDFENEYINNSSIIFPHKLLDDKRIVTYECIKSFFIIFETVYKKNILHNFKNEMPLNYTNFKLLILKQLNSE